MPSRTRQPGSTPLHPLPSAARLLRRGLNTMVVDRPSGACRFQQTASPGERRQGRHLPCAAWPQGRGRPGPPCSCWTRNHGSAARSSSKGSSTDRRRAEKPSRCGCTGSGGNSGCTRGAQGGRGTASCSSAASGCGAPRCCSSAGTSGTACCSACGERWGPAGAGTRFGAGGSAISSRSKERNASGRGEAACCRRAGETRQ